MRRVVSACACLVVTFSLLSIRIAPVFCAPVDDRTALQVARTWLSANRAPITRGAGTGSLTAKGARPFRDARGKTLGFIVDLDPKGFVVVPADDLIEPILCFGTQGNLAGRLGPGEVLADILVQDIPTRLRSAQASDGRARSDVAGRWSSLRTPDAVSRAAVTPAVGPLVWALWDQGRPYNSRVPNGLPTGCTATAMGMIINYFRYPPTAAGTNQITVQGIPQQRTFQDNFDYSLMPASLDGTSSTAQVQQVAKLLFDCGVAVGTDYAAESSASRTALPNAYKQFFRYTSADWKQGTASDWMTVVKNELNAGFPVQMSLTDTANEVGHSVVCDGWGTEGTLTRLHLNLGWSGQWNSWYAVPGFTTSGHTWSVLNGYVYNIRAPGVKTWTGAQTSSWFNAANWSPGGVPTSRDDVIIPGGPTNQPILARAAAARNLTVDRGARLTLNGNTLTVGGDLAVVLDSRRGTGLIMSNGPDTLVVNGNARFTTAEDQGAATTVGNLVAGVLKVRGNFTQTNGGGVYGSSGLSFASTGTKVTFDGTEPQTVAFLNPGAGTSRFCDINITNRAGVSLGSNVYVAGQMTVASGGVLSQASGLGIYYTGKLPIIAGGTYNVPSSYISGQVRASAPTLVFPQPTNDLFVEPGAALILNGKSVTVGGALTVTLTNAPGSGLIMTNAPDTLIVNGNARFTTSENQGAATTVGNLVAGVLKVRGNFTQTNGGGVYGSSGLSFASTGTKVTFDGTEPQTVAFLNPGAGTSRFCDINITNRAGVSLGSNVYVAGQMTVASGGVLSQASGLGIYYTGKLPIIAGGTYNVPSSYISGQVRASAPTLVFPQPTNDLFVEPGAALILNGKSVTVGGALTVTLTNAPGSGLIMTNAPDTLIVNGNARFTTSENQGAATTVGNLVAGVLKVRGNFTQTNGGGVYGSSGLSFASTGTKVVFDGTEPQTVAFTNPGAGGSHFAGIQIANPSGVSVNSDVLVAGPFTNTGVLTIPSTRKVTVSGNSPTNAAGGVLQGAGTLDVSRSGLINAGTLSPGLSPGPGVLTIVGSLTQSATGVIRIDVGGNSTTTGLDKLNVSGNTVLNGTLNVGMINEFLPSDGDRFSVLAFPSHSGRFSRVNGLDTGSGRVFDLVYTGTGADLLAQVLAGTRPDLLIKKASEATSAFGGGGSYQAAPAGSQIETQSVARGGTAIYDIKVENDGNTARTFALKGMETAGSGWTVVYRAGVAVVTAAMHSTSGYVTGSLAPGAYEIIRVDLSPASTVTVGAAKSATVRVFLSGSDATVRDGVTATASASSATVATKRDPEAHAGLPTISLKATSGGAAATAWLTPNGLESDGTGPGSEIYFSALPGSDPPALAGRWCWDFTVETRSDDAPITLCWPDLSRLSREDTLLLEDLDAGARRSMRTSPAYQFRPGDGLRRRFRVSLGSRVPGPPLITGLDVTPTRSGTRVVRLTLSLSAAVDLDVLSPAGRVVATVSHGRALPAGVNQLVWGGPVQPGLYLLRATATSEEGLRVQTVRPAVVTR